MLTDISTGILFQKNKKTSEKKLHRQIKSRVTVPIEVEVASEHINQNCSLEILMWRRTDFQVYLKYFRAIGRLNNILLNSSVQHNVLSSLPRFQQFHSSVLTKFCLVFNETVSGKHALSVKQTLWVRCCGIVGREGVSWVHCAVHSSLTRRTEVMKHFEFGNVLPYMEEREREREREREKQNALSCRHNIRYAEG